MGVFREELDKLNKLACKAIEETILNWIETEGYSVDGPVVLDDSEGF